MPNYCENELTVTGSPEKLLEFKKRVSSKKEDLGTQSIEQQVIDRLLHREDEEGLILDAERIKPYPKGLNYDRRDWRVENWGTKWLDEPSLSELTGALLYSFDTAWSPPCSLVLEMGRMFPELCFELQYWEGGAGFQGTFIMENGKVITNEHTDYSGDRGG